MTALRDMIRRLRGKPEPRHARHIEAGGGGWRWSGTPTLTAPNNAILAAHTPARHRAAALAANSAVAAAAVESWTAALAGAGGWQVRSGHPDRDTAAALSDEFEGIIHPALPIVARALCRDGESFTRILTGPDRFRVRHLPAGQIDASLTRNLEGDRAIVAGIEIDGDDEPIAYHVHRTPPDAPFNLLGETVRVSADEMLHVYDRLHPGQIRGLTWLHPALAKLSDFDAASDAMLMSLKTQALFAGFIIDLNGGTGGFDGNESGGAVNLALEPGGMRFLPAGTDIKFAQPGGGLSQQAEFLKIQLHEIAAALGLPYEVVTGDLSQTNYSSARFGALQFRRRAEMLQKTLIEGQFLRPLWRRFIAWKALTGDVPADAAASPDYNVTFTPPGWPTIDPLKETNADIRALEAGLKSRAEIIAARGRDPDEVDREIEADRIPARQEVTQ